MGMLLMLLALTGCAQSDLGPMPEDDFLIIGHRGASAYMPENTVAAFSFAEDLDADYVELDIHLSKDDELVIRHDQEVDDLEGAEGDVRDYTSEELKELSIETVEADAGETQAVSGQVEEYAIPKLADVLEEFGEDLNFVIELKDTKDYPGIEEKLVEMIKEYDMIQFTDKGYPHVVIQSFDKKALKKIHKLNEDIPLIYLISFKDEEDAELSEEEIEAIKKYAAGVGISYEALTEPFVRNMYKNNLAVYAYTVNDNDVALRLKEMGVNGVFTDRPDLTVD